jgi:hypothetical protein
MPVPKHDFSLEVTGAICGECKNPVRLICGEVDDGQGHGGTESTTYYWCYKCDEEKDSDELIPDINSSNISPTKFLVI